MHIYNLDNWKHSHDFTALNRKGEHRTRLVLVLTAVTMIGEIIAGIAYGSMALLADGWHMGTHVAAFMITLFAYQYTRKNANNPAYTFGSTKVNALGGFASSVALVVVALVMAIESLQRIIKPQAIHFNEAIIVASIGLLVNIVSAFLLKNDHGNHHNQEDEMNGHHHDHNLRAAYFHVLADALTSILAIIALLSGKYFGWNWLDPIMGIVGALIITRWAYGLLKQTSPILLDASKGEYQHKIKEIIEKDSDNRVTDIHVWELGTDNYAAIISLVTHYPKTAEHYKSLLKGMNHLSHITIEVNECKERPCIEINKTQPGSAGRNTTKKEL